MNDSNDQGTRRVIIENLQPSVDNGAFPAKRVVGETVKVQADIFADGHDRVVAEMLYRTETESDWHTAPMQFLGNDRWQASFTIDEMVPYRFTVRGWIDRFLTWQSDLEKKYDAGQDLEVELQIGALFIDAAVNRVPEKTAERLRELAAILRIKGQIEDAVDVALGEELSEIMAAYPDTTRATQFHRESVISVDPPKALFSTWYELFPRSTGPDVTTHGTFKDVMKRLPDIAEMGFDVLYLPPIHPIGKVHRKGKNNSPISEPGEPGSPWAIGSDEGGHKAIHPQLGSMEDFQRLVVESRKHGIDVALDIAFQCAPDHPYVEEHPEWFRTRPDGTIQYAENPPKKYEDIVPFDFETDHWKELWEELKSVVVFWADAGVKIFRVDNPHTKSFPFWEWLMGEMKRDYPEVIFLSEAFTRPRTMYRLAKIGFNQSYTYFTWRNTKHELTSYLEQLTQTEVGDYFRPNFWPNTPDILPEYLQFGGRPAFISRLVLAATLSSNYGMYGPAFELCVSDAVPGKEEYLNSEKYEIKQWDLEQPGNLRDLITRVNTIRKENPALQLTRNLTFYEVDNDYMLFYGKQTDDGANTILVLVNLDPYHTQSGWVRVPLAEIGIDHDRPFLAHDLLGGDRYIWQGERNYVQLNPHSMPAHIFRIRRRLRREMDFDYYM